MVACIFKNTNSVIVKNEPVVHQDKINEPDTLLVNEAVQQQLSGLATYVEATSFSAVISNINIQTTTSATEDKHIIKAKVLDLFRGEAEEYIEFEMLTESGETLNFEDTILICLCQNDEQLYWAGAGSVFPASELFISKAKNILEKATNSTASFCDE